MSGGCGRPCVQRQAPAVQGVRVEGAPDSVHRPSVDFPLFAETCTHSANCAVSMPVVAVQTVEPVEIPQLQFLDEVVVLPVVMQDRGYRPDSAEIRRVSARPVLGQG